MHALGPVVGSERVSNGKLVDAGLTLPRRQVPDGVGLTNDERNSSIFVFLDED